MKTATKTGIKTASETATAAATGTAPLTRAAPSAGPSPRPARSRWGRISFLTMVPTCGLLLVGAPPAAAHDTLIASTPEADEVLEESPEEILLEFSGDGLTTGDTITNAIVVRDAEGENWEGETEVEGSTMSTELPESLPNGEYEILYRVVYSDGHDEELSFGFEVDDPDDADDASEAEDEPASDEGTEPAESAEAESGAEDEAGSASESDADEAGDDSTENAEATDATSDESGNPVPAWLVVAVAAVAVAGGAALIVARRRRR